MPALLQIPFYPSLSMAMYWNKKNSLNPINYKIQAIFTVTIYTIPHIGSNGAEKSSEECPHCPRYLIE